MRLPTIALAAALALIPATAHAKEVAGARACDDDGCRTITAKGTLRAMEGGAPAAAPAEGAPFHRVRMTVKVEGEKEFSYTMAYVPSAGLMRFRGEFGGYEWLAATPRAKRGFERLLRGLEPLPARRLRGAGAVEEEPVAQVHKVVPAPVAGDGGGDFPWTLLLIPGGLVLAAAAWRATKSRAAHGPLARERLS